MLKKPSNSVRHDAAPRDSVFAVLREWSKRVRAGRPEVVRIGVFGSYARGDYLPSSDADVMVEVSESPHARWFDRSVDFPYPSGAPVGVEIFIYTSGEIARMEHEGSPWLARIRAEAVWL